MKIVRKSILCAFVLFAAFKGYSQNVREAVTKVNKVEQKAIVADYAYSKSIVEMALEDKFSRANLGKSKSKSGYDLYTGVSWPEISATDKLDVYVKTEEKKGNTTVTMLISRGYDNFLTAPTDQLPVDNLKSFLTNLTTGIQAVDLAKKIEAQGKVIKTTEDKTADLKKDYDKLQNEKNKIEKSMEQNLEAQKKSVSETDAANAVLDNLKSQQIQ